MFFQNEQKVWSGFWAPADLSQGEKDELTHDLDDLRQKALGTEVPTVSLQEFMHSLNTYHKDSKGADNWMASELQILPAEILKFFNAFFKPQHF